MYKLSVATLCACLSTCTVPHHGIKFAAAQDEKPKHEYYCVSHRSGTQCIRRDYLEMKKAIDKANAEAKAKYDAEQKAKRTRQPQQR